MTIRVNFENKTIILSVKDLALAELDKGSIVPESSLPARAALGRSIHGKHQNNRQDTDTAYRREVTVKYETDLFDFHITVQGRIDGVYEQKGKLVVEEIKSVFNTASIQLSFENNRYEAYILQLQYYIWLLEKKTGKEVKGLLVFIPIAAGSIEKTEVDFDETAVLNHFRKRIESIIEEATLRHEWQIEQRRFAEKLEFPFTSKRKYQQEMMDETETALLRGQDLMVSAPTGVGKTIAALFPTLRLALHKGMRIFFTTSKTTQQRIVVDSLKLLNGNNHRIYAIHIRAKEKMCANSIYFCHSDFCPFARNYYGKLKTSGAIDELLKRRTITPEAVYEVGVLHKLCPFELSLDVSLRCDVIVCDYNYVFDPSVYLRRFFLDKYDDSILIIDEAHNLYQRGMEYYSPTLKRAFINEIIHANSDSKTPVLIELCEVLESLDMYFHTLDNFGTEEHGNVEEYLVNLDMDFFDEVKEKLDEITVKYYVYKKQSSVPLQEDPIQQFLRNFSLFHYVLSLKGDEFSHIYKRRGESHIIRILCSDPSSQLGKRIEGFYSTIAMSATLEPQQFYRDVLGFDRDKTTLRHFPSPFPKENRKIMVVPQISTKYSVRHRFYEKTAQIINDIVNLHYGNYLVFFPSFEFLENVYAYMPLRHHEIMCQQRFMSENERSVVIQRLKEEKALVVFAVQSGIFAEGVDYPGDMATCAIIVGPGLPQFNFEQELRKYYYAEYYGMGFEYAYLYPGMRRIIQSAGRVIRSEEDKGIIVLLGRRFATKYYNSLFPTDWYEHSPDELVSQDYIEEIREFWKSTDET